MFELSKEEFAVFKKLSSPNKIQDFLDTLAINHEKRGETCMSPRQVLREKKAHCLEGALFAATALWLHGENPLLLNMETTDIDDDHALALYKRNGYWGAISKTNHGVLRFRDPVYRSTRELALSYFHEYFLTKTGHKTLRAYSRPFSLKRFGTKWITAEENLWDIAHALDESTHFSIIPNGFAKHLRPASLTERASGSIAEWSKKDPRTY
ncbi:MAG: hypothetical protein HZB12_02775 [Candidatus Yonathbacteria bacterium]|nr:hypothetical protein [Candidatus Yonathbacteria bacterium]